MKLHKYFSLVEKALEHLSLNPEECRGENEGQWEFVYQRATVMIDVYSIEAHTYFQALVMITKIPKQTPEMFYQKLLEYNHTFISTAFTKYKDWIFLKSAREFNDLSIEEIKNIIKRVAVYGDNMIKKISQEIIFNKEKSDVYSIIDRLIEIIEHKDFQAIKEFCHPSIKVSPILQQLCNYEQLSKNERKKITEYFSAFQLKRNVSFFEHQGQEYARIPAIYNKKISNLILIRYKNKWFLYTLNE